LRPAPAGKLSDQATPLVHRLRGETGLGEIIGEVVVDIDAPDISVIEIAPLRWLERVPLRLGCKGNDLPPGISLALM